MPGVGERIDVLDHGFVRLDAAEATDLSVVNGARVSFLQIKEEMDDRDEKLIRFLMREKHASPFEHNLFRFHVKCPIAVGREWMRHRWSSFNEHSLRYSQAIDSFYVPAPEQVRTQTGKPGAYTFVPVDAETAERARSMMDASYRQAWDTYQSMLEMGVARELARFVLPVGLYTEFYWTVNARALMNFISLRNAEAAMWEIRQYGDAVEKFFAALMPCTHKAFEEFGRVAP
ncbi:MAG TPA: FAD-dependent thymidylate synthase [Actinomycetota bacterium]|nr:FAD-dependent thymidylate synthase [Actinomycetota bacterium]